MGKGPIKESESSLILPSKSTTTSGNFVVQRKGFGQQGRKVEVLANYFKVNEFPTSTIYQYDLNMNLDIPRPYARQVFQRFREKYADRFEGIAVAYDGCKLLYAMEALPFDQATFPVTLDDELPKAAAKKQQKGKPIAPRTINIVIKKTATVNMFKLLNFLAGKSAEYPSDCLMALEVLMAHFPTLYNKEVGRSVFRPSDNLRPLSGAVGLSSGHYQTFRCSKGQLLLNADVANAVFWEPANMVESLCKFCGVASPHDLKRATRKDFVSYEKAIMGIKATINHRGNIKRKIAVRGLSKKSAEESMFECDGKEISVAHYFKTTYGKALQYPFLPCAMVGQKQNLFPLEVLDIISGQKFLKKLDERQTADMIKMTCQKPQEREKKIYAGINQFGCFTEAYNQFGISIGEDMVKVSARQLQPPNVQYGGGATIKPDSGSWNMRGKRFIQPVTLSSWSVLICASQREANSADVKKFIEVFVRSLEDIGIKVEFKYPPIVDGGRDHLGGLRNAYENARKATNRDPQFILVVLPFAKSTMYEDIKRVSETSVGFMTQCMKCSNLRKANPMYCANLALKLNAKLGGKNCALSKESLPILATPTIIIGADITHPGKGSDDASIAAVVASVDPSGFRYVSVQRKQEKRVEIIVELKDIVKELLTTFKNLTRMKPQRIIFYRDGVSSGEYSTIISTEVRAIREACASLEKDYNPPITFAAVQKRHHTRFFPNDHRDADRSGNVKAGTVVDSGITHPTDFDFYLMSHGGLQGTSRPTHYQMLVDENGFNSDSFQSFTNNLCYLYARCTKSVSIPPPVYYAHLSAARAKCHLPRQRNENVDVGLLPLHKNIKPTMFFV